MRDGLAGCERKNPAEKLRRVFGAPGGIRTPDTLLKRQVLCRLSYWGIKIGWDGGARTHNTGVKVPCVTVTPYPNTTALYHSGFLYVKRKPLSLFFIYS